MMRILKELAAELVASVCHAARAGAPQDTPA
jgi:hypothetical protein